MRPFILNVYAIILIQIITPARLTPSTQPNQTRDVSHEDIRDAILSLIHMFRDNTDKLERHEYRERQLGDQLKKTLGSIEKKQTKIEETTRISEVLNTINQRLESLESTISKEKNTPVSDIWTNFQQTIHKKIGNIEESIQRNELVMESMRSNSIQKLETILSNVLQSQSVISALDQKVLQTISENAELINRMEAKLAKVESFHDKLEQISASQQSAIERLESMRQSVSQNAGKEEGNCQFSNLMTQKLDELRYVIQQISENDTVKCHGETEKTQSLINQNHQTILSAISERATSDENKNADKKYDELLKEFKDLSKIEQVLIQTADNVLDTKRRIEYGTHQILTEVEELIKVSSKESNETVNRRFDTISAEILNSTNGALQNLSSKLETEISQVWRQIGIMYETLTNSADALDKLQQQTEIYVNGSLSTMDNMEGKVGQITGRMSEVDENLNYLLGRLSLVTQEFNQIKTGLGQALDNIRKSFHTVQEKVKDVGPGPNPIEEEEGGPVSVNTPLQKTKYDTVN